ncbi:hypothetical protein AYX19_21650 (plasmid) [Paenarthrobacter ureafaciens]|nr:hypothetical protein AYX19_21650 [Paenarthrobacter ureafaciens]
MLQRALPSEDFAWSLIEFGGDHSQVFAGVDAEICSFRKVLAEQAVGVLVGSALPGAGWVAEVDRDECLPREILVAGLTKRWPLPKVNARFLSASWDR